MNPVQELEPYRRSIAGARQALDERRDHLQKSQED